MHTETGDLATMTDEATLDALEDRIRTLLPESYEGRYESVQPVPMRSAGLKYAADGTVAWNEIWTTFCDLALAGGPPHRGTWLEPPRLEEIDARPADYARVRDELCRGLSMTTGLVTEPSPRPGWVRITCGSEGMAQWLLRAIVIENVSARAEGVWLDLPAGPTFRLEKEIKNVITATAKTCHYWLGHTSLARRQAIRDLFSAMVGPVPLIEPDQSLEAWPAAGAGGRVIDGLHRGSGLMPSSRAYRGWFGLEARTTRAAIWMMRALVATNVLSRREETTLFVPVNPAADPDGDRVARTVAVAHRLAILKGVW